MHSHSYQFTSRDLLRLTALPALVVLAFAAAMHLGARTNLLPSPKPILDTDRTIVLHQASVAHYPSSSSAEILLIGDSSCLMNVNARELDRLTGKRVLNLATLSYVPLQDHALLLRNYLSNHTSVRAVVLLMHPESLRLASRPAYYSDVLHSYLAGRDHFTESKTIRLTGAATFRHRLLTRLLPLPLSGEFAEHYGFNRNLWNHLTENNGSALDPHTYTEPPTGNPDYRLAPQLESPTRNFRANLPPSLQIIVGLTPSPSDYALRNHSENSRAILATWSNWLSANASLTNLPTSLPPNRFATATHLNSGGVSEYTSLLASELNADLP